LVGRLNDFCVRAPRPPVTDFPQSGSDGRSLALRDNVAVRRLSDGRSLALRDNVAVRRLEADGGLDSGEPGFGYEVSVGRYRSIRKCWRVAIGFFDKCSGSRRLTIIARVLPFALSVSIRSDACPTRRIPPTGF
jgi:hypothetical protein